MRTIFLLWTISLLAACKPKTTSIDIELRSHKSDHSKYTLLDMNDQEVLIIDTLTLLRGKGKLHTTIKEGLYAIQKKNSKPLYLYLIPGEKATITFSQNDYSITGSPYSDSIHALSSQERWLDAQYLNIDTQIPKNKGKYVDSLLQLKNSFKERYTENIKKFINNQTKADVACFGFVYLKDDMSAIPFMLEKVETLYKEAPNSTFIALWRSSLLDYAEKVTSQFTDGLPLGSYAPDITAQTPSGDTIMLKDLKGKYVLLDFWSSSCQPCRKNNPKIVSLYKDLQGKNFDIFSFSLDKKMEHWLRAIQVDKLTWYYQGCDFKEWDSPTAVAYKVESIPTTYLINPKGKIIGRDLPTDSIKAIVIKGL